MHRLKSKSEKHPTFCKFRKSAVRLTGILAILLCIGVGAFAAEFEDETFKCQEECQTARDERVSAYEDCEKKAEVMPDRLAAIRQKQNCRSRYPIPNCDDLKPCQPQPGLINPMPKADMAMSELSLLVLQNIGSQRPGQNVFYQGQTVWVRYDVSLSSPGIGAGENLAFDQKISIFNSAGDEVFDSHEKFKREGGKLSSYQFKSSFLIPSKFKTGQYRIKVHLRERFSGFNAVRQREFEVAD